MIPSLKTQQNPKSTFSYSAAFSRNLGIFSQEEQNVLRSQHVAIPGCGGVGAIHALVMARMGIGHFTIADFDQYEVENFNRQFGAKSSTVGMEKVEVVRQEILDINPTATVRIFREGVNKENLSDFLAGVNLVVDSLDFFAFEARDLLFPRAQELGIPLITAAPLGMSSAMLVFTKTSMSYWKYFGFVSGEPREVRALKLALGLAPKATHVAYMDSSKIDFVNGKGPSVAVGVSLCAAMAGAEAAKILLGRGSVRVAPCFAQFDSYLGVFRTGKLHFGSHNPFQVFKRWYLKKYYLSAITGRKGTP